MKPTKSLETACKTVVIFDHNEDVGAFEYIRRQGYCAMHIPFDSEPDDTAQLGERDVIIYQATGPEARERATKLAKHLDNHCHCKSIRVLQAPAPESLMNWLDETFPEGVPAMDVILSRSDRKLKDPAAGAQLKMRHFEALFYSDNNIKRRVINRDIVEDIYSDTDYPVDTRLLMEPWLDEETLTLVSAPAGAGKTWFALEIACACSEGRDAFDGFWKVPGPVNPLFVDGEMQQGRWRNRMGVMNSTGRLKYISKSKIQKEGIEPPLDLDNEETRIRLSKIIEEGEFKLVVFDNLISLLSNFNRIGQKSWGEINNWLLRLRADKVAVILIHHTGKASGADQLGTVTRTTNVDISLILKPIDTVMSESKICKFGIEVQKDRNAVVSDIDDVIFSLEDGVWSIEYKSESDPLLPSDKFNMKMLTASKMLIDGHTQKEVAGRLEVSESKVSRNYMRILKGEKPPHTAWIRKAENGKYEFTEYGKKMWDEYEEQADDKKQAELVSED